MADKHGSLELNSEELELLTKLLQAEKARLLVEIRHTDHRSFREELRERLTIIEGLAARCGDAPVPAR